MESCESYAVQLRAEQLPIWAAAPLSAQFRVGWVSGAPDIRASLVAGSRVRAGLAGASGARA
jgi:hypothetical protein